MRALLLLLLSLFSVSRGAGDEQYAYLAGLAEKGLPELVVREAQGFLRDHPQHAKADLARYRLANALFQLDRRGDAARELRVLTQKSGFEFETEVQFRLGQCELGEGRCEEASQAFARVRSNGKPYLRTAATALQGEALYQCKDYSGAAACCSSVLESDPAGEYAADARCTLAWCQFQLGRKDAAIATIRAQLAQPKPPPRADELRFLLGECLLDTGAVDDALEAYGSVKEGAFADAALRGSGFAHAARGDHEAAARAFGALVERWPESRYAAECALQGAIECLNAKNARAALALLDARAAGDGVEVSYWRARAQLMSGAHAAALATLERALARKPAPELASRLLVAKGETLWALGRQKEAIAAYEGAQSSDGLRLAANASLNAKDPAQALRFANALLERCSADACRVDALLLMGESRMLQRDYQQADESFRAASEAESSAPRRVHALSRSAWCKYLAGDTPVAAQRFDELAQRFPDTSEGEEALFMHARALEALDAPAALAGYQAYLARHAQGAHVEDCVLRMARLEPDAQGIERLEAFVRAQPPARKLVEARYQLAERYCASTQYERAEPHYAAVLAAPAESELAFAARYGLAWCHYNRAAYPACVEALAPVVRDEHAPAPLREAGAELALWAECKAAHTPAIAGAWRTLAELTSDEPRLLQATELALGALRKADQTAACDALLDSFERAARAPASRAAIAAERASLLIDRKQLDAAQRVLDGALARTPAEPCLLEALLAVAEARFDAGAFEQAVPLYARVADAAQAPCSERALYKQAFAHVRLNDLAAAEAALERLLAADPRAPQADDALFLLAEVQFRANEDQAAIENFERLRKQTSSTSLLPKLLFRLGIARCRTQGFKQSVECLSTLLREYPGFEQTNEAQLWHGRALAGIGDRRGARQAFERVIAADKSLLSAQAHIELGLQHKADGRLDPALSEFLKVAVLYEDASEVPRALYLAGETLEAQGDSKAARKQYDEVVAKYPRSQSAEPARARLNALEHQ